MVYSAEVRWFFDSLSRAEGLENWFKANGLHFAGQWDRADIYLQQKDLMTHSVKIREGKLEVKVMQEAGTVLTLANGNAGVTNSWVKYSFELKESDTENQALLQAVSKSPEKEESNTWLRIDKERLLLKYAIDTANQSFKKIPAAEWPDEGCGVELTKIKVNQQKEYYTFGFEAFSKSRQESRNLALIVTQLFHEVPISGLNTPLSQAYPAFLATINQPA